MTKNTKKVQETSSPVSKNFLPQGKYLKPDEIEYEFGGTAGVLGMLIGFPLLMYYMWICAEFYNGTIAPVSYTHLDVYKRQALFYVDS